MFNRTACKRRTPAEMATWPGFSLVEVLISSAVIVLGMLALISLFPVSSANIVGSSGNTAAITLASQQIEHMRNLPFPPAGGTDTPAVQGITYTRTWTVIVCDQFPPDPPGCPLPPPTSPNRWAQIAVTITWPGRGGNLPLTTVIAE